MGQRFRRSAVTTHPPGGLIGAGKPLPPKGNVKEVLAALGLVILVAAAAYPIIDRYKRDAADQLAVLQLRAMAVAMESYFVVENRYPENRSILFRYGYKPEDDVTVEGPFPGNTKSLMSSWSARAWHSGGLKTFRWNPGKGEVEEVAP